MSAVLTPPAVNPGGLTSPGSPSPESPRTWRWSREDYYKLGELGFFRGKRVELIRGEILEMCPLNEPHVAGVTLTADALRAAFGTGYYVRVQAPLAVGTSDPEPDVTVVPGGPRDYTSAPTTALLVVEVSDATLFYDTTTKAELYATAGIADYWVLDVTNRQLHVFRDPMPIPEGGQAYRTRLTIGSGDVVAPLAASHIPIRAADLLP